MGRLRLPHKHPGEEVVDLVVAVLPVVSLAVPWRPASALRMPAGSAEGEDEERMQPAHPRLLRLHPGSAGGDGTVDNAKSAGWLTLSLSLS